MSQDSNPIKTTDPVSPPNNRTSSTMAEAHTGNTENKPHFGAYLLSWINFVLLIVLISSAGYVGFLGWQQQQKALVDIALLQDRIATADSLQADNEQRQQELLALAKKLNTASTVLTDQVNFNSERLAKLPGAERQDWLLAEVEYLLRLANQRLMLERDWNGALSLLAAADNVLVETRNPRYNPIRAQISREIQALRAVPSVDRTGTIYKLQTLQEIIANLQWAPQQYQSEATQPIMTESESAASTPVETKWEWEWDQLSIPMLQQAALYWWQQAQQSVTQNLRSLIRVRRLEDDLPAPLSPDQQYYLQQNMHLMLEQAQVAILREQTALFQHSITRVTQWVDQFVIVEDAQARSVLDTLNDLQQWNAAPTLPDISVSLFNLRQLLEQQRRGSVVMSAIDKNDSTQVVETQQ